MLLSLFTPTGDFTHDHDLEAHAWDGHSYDCPSSSTTPTCTCDPEAGLAWLHTPEDTDPDEADYEADAIDYATYISSR